MSSDLENVRTAWMTQIVALSIGALCVFLPWGSVSVSGTINISGAGSGINIWEGVIALLAGIAAIVVTALESSNDSPTLRGWSLGLTIAILAITVIGFLQIAATSDQTVSTSDAFGNPSTITASVSPAIGLYLSLIAFIVATVSAFKVRSEFN